MKQYTYEIIEEGAVPEKEEYDHSKYTIFHEYLKHNGAKFEEFKDMFRHDKRVLRVKFNNIPTRKPSKTKMEQWKNNNNYTGKLTAGDISIFARENNMSKPDIFETVYVDEKTELMSERQLKNELAESYYYPGDAYHGGNHKSRRNRNRKNRSSRINARISRNLII